MVYTLTKLSIKEGHNSSVRVGKTVSGNQLRVIRYVTPEELKEDDEVFVGNQVGDYVKTSPLERIEKNTTGNLTLITRTSIYHLEEIEDNDSE